MTKNSNGRFRIFCLIAVSIIAFGCLMSALALRNSTMVSFIGVALCCLVAGTVAGVVATPVIHRMTRLNSFALNAVIASAMLTCIFAGAFYILNFTLANDESSHSERALIERRYHETRYRSKRISRNRYTRGEPYRVYYLDVRYQSGAIKPMLVTRERYSRLRTGDSIEVNISRGLFGFPVVKGYTHLSPTGSER